MLFEREFIPVFHHRINADDLLNHLVAKHERSRAATAVEIQCLHAGTGLAHRTADGLVFAFAHAKSIIPALLIEVVVTVAGNVLAKGIVRMTGCNVTTIATRPLPVLQTFRGKEAGVAGCEKERVISLAGASELLDRGFLVSTHRLSALPLAFCSFLAQAKYSHNERFFSGHRRGHENH